MGRRGGNCSDCGVPTTGEGYRCRTHAHRIPGRKYYDACIDCGIPKPRLRGDTGARCNPCAGKARRSDAHTLEGWLKWPSWVKRCQVIEWLGGVCTDCGYADNLAALEFDHIEPRTYKQYTLSSMLGQSFAYVLGELPKVELVCSNCHSIRTDIRRRT